MPNLLLDGVMTTIPAESAMAYIGLGSNIDPEHNLTQALQLLAERLHLVSVSPVYVTPPWGYAPQADFLNAVLCVATDLLPLNLLDLLLETELACGRERTIPNGPRTLDLDLLLVGENVMDTPRLTLPHPRLHERGFVLVPLCDLAPALTHPITGLSVIQMAAALPMSETVDIRPSPFQLSLTD